MFVYYSYVYAQLFVYLVMVLGVCSLMIGIGYIISENNQYFEKGIGYECGFDPFSDARDPRSEEHTSELQSRENLVCRLLLEKKNKIISNYKIIFIFIFLY